MALKNIKDQLKETQSALHIFSTHINSRKDIERLHRGNLFNRRFSAMLSSYDNFETVGSRLERTILQYQILERKIQYEMRDKRDIPDELQPLMKEANRFGRENQADFKSLYIFAKIFLDEFTALFGFIHNWRGISSGSITSFYNSVTNYTGEDEKVLAFKSICLGRLKAADVFVTQYRDTHIVHDQTEHKETRWFLNDMRGGIRFIGGRPSVTPIELVFVAAGYVADTIDYTKKHL